MNNNRSYFFLLVSFLFLNIVFGQTVLSVKEQQIFKTKVQETANKITSIMSDFEQSKHLEMLSKPILSEGKLVFESPDKILWQYTSPKAYQVIFKDEMLYVDNDGKNDEIKLSSNKVFRSFNELIVNSIKGDMFDESMFDISYFKISEGHLVKFFPKDKRMKRFISAFELTFTQNTGEVTKIKLVEPNNDYTLITFNNRKTNSKIPSETFTQ
ncbi:outer membrane lipoprotein carrier protein LolA [Rasiella sp. SM2506]|uniref:outer membrane lipoprotein carrier protein LolA n=1 Tax=Rasiella sp. SM2506 TaxID=3423914 RepID=UPI003D7A19E6